MAGYASYLWDRTLEQVSKVLPDPFMTLAHIRTIQSCDCEEWNDEATSALVKLEIASGFALAMNFFESFRVIRTDTTLKNP